MATVNQDTRRGPSFSLGNRLMRLLWQIVWLVAFRPSLRPFHAWRAFLLRLFGAQLAKGCHVYPDIKIWAPWNLKMGRHACLGEGVKVYNQALITLGDEAVVSQFTHLCTGTHDYRLPGFPLFTYPITIGEGVWVGADCFVGPGVTIGAHAVVGARSVVVKDLPEGHVCVGHPCKPIKKIEIW
jgi:putative colanic acid biosynthesis acetyltransferase WcaF